MARRVRTAPTGAGHPRRAGGSYKPGARWDARTHAHTPENDRWQQERKDAEDRC